MKTRFALIVIPLILLALSATSAGAGDFLHEGWRYRVLTPIHSFRVGTDTTCYTAQPGSQFEVIIQKNDTLYVRFKKVKNSGDDKTKQSTVSKDGVFWIDAKKIDETTCEFGQGPYVGVLTLPFKYHPKTATAPDVLASDFTVSGVFGWTTIIRGTNFRFTPMLFLGYANVALANGTNVEPQPGLTWGGGFALSITRSVQLGIVVGGDHVTGSKGSEFPYQDKAWYSVSLGATLWDI